MLSASILGPRSSASSWVCCREGWLGLETWTKQNCNFKISLPFHLEFSMFPSSPFFFFNAFLKLGYHSLTCLKLVFGVLCTGVGSLSQWMCQAILKFSRKDLQSLGTLAFLYLPGQKLPTFFTQVSSIQRDRVEQGAVSPCFFESAESCV